MAIKIYIDQGHNRRNPNAGAEAFGLREQDLVFEIGIRLAELLRANENFNVLLSRPTIETQLGTSNATSLAARVNNANSWGANYFISIHANASTVSTASGSEGYAYSRDSQGYALGEKMLVGLNRETGLPNRGMYIRPGLYVLRKTNMPAVLMEMAYITNYGDAMLMKTRPDLFAQGLYNGILAYFNLL